jgi:excisionase family DNA binding protein
MNTRPRIDIATAEDIERVEAKLDRLTAMIEGATVSPAPEWVSMSEAARRKGVHRSTIDRWIKEQRLQARGAGKLREVRVV